MIKRSDLLVVSAARLYSLGIDLEAAKCRVDAIADSCGCLSSPELVEAYRELDKLSTMWHDLEREHLSLLGEILSGK